MKTQSGLVHCEGQWENSIDERNGKEKVDRENKYEVIIGTHLVNFGDLWTVIKVSIIVVCFSGVSKRTNNIFPLPSDLCEQRGRTQRLHPSGERKEERLRALRRPGNHLRLKSSEERKETGEGRSGHPDARGEGEGSWTYHVASGGSSLHQKSWSLDSERTSGFVSEVCACLTPCPHRETPGQQSAWCLQGGRRSPFHWIWFIEQMCLRAFPHPV